MAALATVFIRSHPATVAYVATDPPSVVPTAVPGPTGAALSANVTGGRPPLVYAWSGAGLTFANAAVANPSVTAVPGTYAATVVATDSLGRLAIGSVAITVPLPPQDDVAAVQAILSALYASRLKLATQAFVSVTISGQQVVFSSAAQVDQQLQLWEAKLSRLNGRRRRVRPM